MMLDLPDLKDIAIELSRKCNIECPHCLTKSNSKFKTKLSHSQIKDRLKQIKLVSNTVSFTGGEPFLFLDLLTFAIKESHKLNLKVSLITNGFWASSKKKAKHILSNLNKYGNLNCIEISTDKFHEKFIPFKNVINAIMGCKDLGIDIRIRTIHIGYTKKKFDDNILLYKKKLKQIKSEIKIYSQPLVMTDKIKINDESIKYSSNLPSKNSCTATKYIFITTNGNVYPCCSTLLQAKYRNLIILGNIKKKSLDKILIGYKKNFILNFLLEFGPQGLIKLIEKTMGNDSTKNLVTKIQINDSCHLCYKLFSSKEIKKILVNIKNTPGKWANKNAKNI